MKYSLLALLTILLLSCTEKTTTFEKIACVSDTTVANLGNERIYKPCRQFVFRAKYWDKEFNLISNQRIWMMATGKSWANDEGQTELAIQYEYEDSEVERIKAFSINKQLMDRDWMRQETTGFIETSTGLWLHPFRANQYLFTEIAPFPMLSYSQLEIGKEWLGGITINDGWGDWSNTKVEQKYQVTEVVSLETEIGLIDDCYHISSVSIAKFGNSSFDYWFNRKYGFVKMLYRNHEGQILQIELMEVVE